MSADFDVIPASGILTVFRRRPDGAPYEVQRCVVGVDYTNERWIVEQEERGVEMAVGYYQPLLDPIPAQPGWYVHARWTLDDNTWERRLPVLAWQRPDPTYPGKGYPPLVLNADDEGVVSVAVSADREGLGDNVTVLGTYHETYAPESE